MSEPLDIEALKQWSEKRSIPYGSEMVMLFPRLADDLSFACEKLERAKTILAEIAALPDSRADECMWMARAGLEELS